ncbi:hypothetical protein A2841_02165 [Candidatus Kaiserbacteria bacterium RIFCSPHIGHO2_01_FULL_48_10]|uniref:Bacterial Ig-like domain-containing protein n=1 Tax=Candidatus Kaiserbacteria bacterium RIFCSPHIGHO2_01_FULL_48_10 TaxID=1798476 RepID=A0A1F6C133_9BACT|nr:MAG: hypothetical protein A2841_02165 [Candidatus Kaiserbacteria bacterium RIFCSPHIGHO2_01_FULL_48_10]HLC99731.1 Ig-like domain-containing protein [Patescibacteria group bacterium]
MKKVIQGIIAFSLILDVAVVFGFGLTLLSSYEDGSLIPKTVTVRRAGQQVAGVSTYTTLQTTTSPLTITNPGEGSTVNNTIALRARAATQFPYVSFDVTQNINGATGFLTATPSSTTLDWEYSLDTKPMPNGSYTIRARAVSGMGENLASSPIVTFNIFNAVSGTTNTSSTTTNSNTTTTTPTPTLSILSPLSGTTISGTTPVGGELTGFSTAWIIREARLLVLKDGAIVLNPPPLAAQVPDHPSMWKSDLQTTLLANGQYDLKFRISYLDSTNVEKPLESTLVRINIGNAVTTDTSTTTTNTSATTNTSTTTNTASFNTNTTSPTNTTDPVVMRYPDPSQYAIFRSLNVNESRLMAQTSVAVSGLDFAIRKVGETAPQRKGATFNSQYNAWMYTWDLTNFNDGEYEITAIGKTSTGEAASKPVLASVQKFSFRWISPTADQKISATTPVRMEINGAYEKDNLTAPTGMIVEISTTNVLALYTSPYKGQAKQRAGTHEWVYEWNTNDSYNGKYRITAKIGALTMDPPLVVEITNPVTTAPSTSTGNQNTNTAVKNTNTASLTNTSINTSTSPRNTNSQSSNANATSATNANAAVTNSSATNAANTNTSTLPDADGDKLSDDEEKTLGTNPNNVDSDGDGLFDYEEVKTQKTDPLKSDTDGDGYSDFMEVHSGNDPRKIPGDKTSTPPPAPKPVEEPKTAGNLTPATLFVTKVQNSTSAPVTPANTNASNQNTQNINESTNNSLSATEDNKIIFEGKGPPNQVLTLFIYSADPLVVTVKTDENGDWSYELDKSLENGEHELYVTVTDDTGKIQSKSNPVSFFIQEAKAVGPEGFRADANVQETPGSSLTNVYLMISGALVLIAVLVGIALAFRRKHDDTQSF